MPVTFTALSQSFSLIKRETIESWVPWIGWCWLGAYVNSGPYTSSEGTAAVFIKGWDLSGLELNQLLVRYRCPGIKGERS